MENQSQNRTNKPTSLLTLIAIHETVPLPSATTACFSLTRTAKPTTPELNENLRSIRHVYRCKFRHTVLQNTAAELVDQASSICSKM